MKITRYLSPDGNGGSGNTSLEDKLFSGFGGGIGAKTPEQIAAEKAADDEKNKGGAGATGGGTPTPEETLKAEQATLETLLAKEEGQLTVDEKKQLDVLKTKYNIVPTKEDGTPYTKEELEAQDKLDKQIKDILAKPEDKRTAEEKKLIAENTEVQKSVYEQVDELTGEAIEVDYAGVDPTSPEGIAKREEVIREKAVVEYDNELKETFPVAYNLMLHMKAGGTLEDFVGNGNDQDYSQITLTKADTKTQEQIYRKALSLKGNTTEQIDDLVKIAKDKTKLFEYSQAELEQLQARQEAEKEQRINQAKQREQRESALADSFFKAIDSSLISGLKGITIPKTEHKGFTQYLRDNKFFIRDGKLLAITEITNENFQDEIAANYFKFKKADLSGIASRKADSILTNKIKAKIKYQITPKTGAEVNKNYVPMNQI